MEFGHLKVVVLEDSKTDMLILRKMLLELGFQKENITEFEKLSELEIGDQQFILSDLNLPDSSGRDTLEAVLAKASSAGIFAIVLSGLADEKLAQESIQMGAQDYLIKATYSSGVLKKTLTFALERYRLMKDAEEQKDQLQQTKQYLSTVLSIAPSVILRVDARFNIEYQNRPVFDKNNENDVVGKTLLDLAPPDELDGIRQRLHELVDKGVLQDFEGRWIDKDGNKVDLLYTASAVGDGTFIVIAFDITDLVESREELELQTIVSREFQLQLLSAQMNPHFIFNALSSIQHSILHAQQEQSLDFLSEFSKLMRSVLENSRKKLITWEEESKFLETYLNTEKFRFEERFEYKLVEDPSLDLDEIMLPPMLIQPYVENTVSHGLKNLKDKRGKVLIGLEREGERLRVSIEDNGVGRKKANSLKALRDGKQHISRALTINERRIELLNTVYETSAFEVRIIDLEDDKGAASGTLVEILFPINLW